MARTGKAVYCDHRIALLVTLSVLKGRYLDAGLELGLCLLLALNRSAFTLGCRNRPLLAMVHAALGTWALAYCAFRVAPLAQGPSGPGDRARAAPLGGARAAPPRSAANELQMQYSLIDALIFAAAVNSGFALRSLMRPVPSANHHVEHGRRAAREIVGGCGDGSDRRHPPARQRRLASVRARRRRAGPTG